ncbi:MAG: VanW family protein [Byssovorax sp.]
MRSKKLPLLLGLALTTSAGGVAAYRFLPRSPVVRGLSVGERIVPDRGSQVASWLAGRQEAYKKRVVRFHHGDHMFESTLDAMGISLDVDATLRDAAQVGHRGSPWKRIKESEQARKGKVEVPLRWNVDESKARAVLATFAPEIARAPVNAKLDLDKHVRIADEPGMELDVDGSLDAIREAGHDDEEMIELRVKSVPAKVTADSLANVNVEKVVSSWETTFSLHGMGENRAINIRTAVSKFDGTVLAPGEVFSFNAAVGPRTKENGFALAPEIQGDEMQYGYGGGTCQSSTTLYAAALFGAMEIVERQSHSRPSTYIKMGLDATVSYPKTDLKIKNTLPYPVILHGYFPKPTAVRVEILGGDPIAKVTHAIEAGPALDFVRRITIKPYLPPGTRVKHQRGIPGFDVTSTVTINYLDGRVEEKKYYSGYRPTPEVYWVSPGYSEELPPLPAHAKGVEDKEKDKASKSGGSGQNGLSGQVASTDIGG